MIMRASALRSRWCGLGGEPVGGGDAERADRALAPTVPRAMPLPMPSSSSVFATSSISAARRSAVDQHPVEIVVGPARPVGARPARVERGGTSSATPAASRGEEAFGGQRLDPLDHHRAQHLDRRGAADRRRRPRRWLKPMRGERRAPASACGPLTSSGTARRGGMDRRHHRDVGITAARRLDRRRRGLLGRRARRC